VNGGSAALQELLEQRRQVADIYCSLVTMRDVSTDDAAPPPNPRTAGVGVDEWLVRFRNGENLIDKGIDSDETFASGRSAKAVMERFAMLFSAGGDET
jgi:hypothetical protein